MSRSSSSSQRLTLYIRFLLFSVIFLLFSINWTVDWTICQSDDRDNLRSKRYGAVLDDVSAFRDIQNSYSGIRPFLREFWVFQPLYTPLSLLFEEEEEEKKRKRCKGETCQKLAGFRRKFGHFHGNFTGNLAISEFPKFPHFFGNLTKISRNFGCP